MNHLKDQIANAVAKQLWKCNDRCVLHGKDAHACADKIIILLNDVISDAMAEKYLEAGAEGERIFTEIKARREEFTYGLRIDLAEQHGRKHGLGELAESLGVIKELVRKVPV